MGLRGWALVLGLSLGAVAPARADELKDFLKRNAKKSGSSTKAPEPPSDPPLDEPPPRASTAAPATLDDPPPSTPAPTPRQHRERSSKPSSEPAAPASGTPTTGKPSAPEGPVGRPGDRRAILTLTVNTVDKGEVFVVLRGRDVLAPVGDLESAGVRDFTGLRETIGGKVHVSMESLATAGVTFVFDERALSLAVSAPVAGLERTVVDLRQPRPADVISSDDGSAFVNYTLRLLDFRRVVGFFEGGATFQNGLLYSQASVTPQGRFVRGLSNLQYALPERTQRFILGDTFATTGLLGGGLFLGGATAIRDFNLDPYFVRFPSAGLGGAVMTPSTVDVYVNGALVRRQDVAPGPFQLDNLPLPVGASNARIVVRDAFGREQVVTAPYYFSTGVLKAGISDYGFHAGFRRNNLATDSWDYAPAVFLGRYRFGFNDVLTPGGRVEGSRNLLSGGPQATWRTPVGDLEAAAAASYDGAPAAPGLATSGGAAGSLSFTHLRPRMNAGAMVRGTSRRYINLSLDAQRDRALVQGDAFAGATLGSRVSLSGRVGLARYRDAGNWSQLGLVGNIHLHELATLYVSGTRTEAETMLHPLYEVFASLTVTLPDRATASAFFQSQNTTASGGAEVQRAMGLGPDYGYRARVTQGTTTDALVSGLAQSEYGRYEATYERFGNRNLTILSTSGAFVTLGGHVFATRPVQQGYGLIQVPGAPGVRGTLNNQVVGRTDGDGNLLVPELIPYYANRLGIADDDLPLDYKVDASARLVAPPLRGGTVATFGVEKLHAVTGSVVMSLGGADVAPSFGQLTVKRGLDEVTSPLGKNGEFYFDNLPPGKYAAEVEAEAGTCKIDVVVPASPNAASAFVDAGRLRCLGRGVPEPGAPPSVEPPPAAAPTSGKGRTP